VINMSIFSVWRRLFSRRRRYKVSFYDSQEVMRRAVEAAGFVDVQDLSEDELRRIASADESDARRKAASVELANRALGKQTAFRSPHAV
jgi:hypothetical protein